ncbi:hypothetical protein ACQ4WX_03225 [Streptomyces lasalocidi]
MRTSTRVLGRTALDQQREWSDFYFGMVFSKCQEAAVFAADLAPSSGLVCFDPQDRRLVP